MPHAECPAEGIQSDENNSLSTSSAETNASQSLSSDGSHRSNGVDWHLSIQCGPLQRQSNLIDALVSGHNSTSYKSISSFYECNVNSQKYAVGTNDMATMTQLYLFVTSSMFGLHRLHIFLPALTALNLDGSSLDSLRDLGAELNIKYLNISRCGLRSLDGINGMTMLQQLIADDNVIEQLLPVTDLSELQILSLKGCDYNTIGCSNGSHVNNHSWFTFNLLQQSHQKARSISMSISVHETCRIEFTCKSNSGSCQLSPNDR